MTIPAAWLRELELKPGDYVELRRADDTVAIEKAESPVESALGLLKRPGRGPFTDAELETMLREAQDEHAEETWRKYRASHGDGESRT